MCQHTHTHTYTRDQEKNEEASFPLLGRASQLATNCLALTSSTHFSTLMKRVAGGVCVCVCAEYQSLQSTRNVRTFLEVDGEDLVLRLG